MTSYRNYIKEKMRQNKTFLFFLLCLISIRWSVADHYRVPSGSMRPTIQIGDHLIVNKMAYDFKIPFTNYVAWKTAEPVRGDIIVFKGTHDPSINMVKRLIGLPGDRIEIQNGIVRLNGKLLTYSTPPSPMPWDEFHYSEKIEDKIYRVKRIPQYFRPQTLNLVVPNGEYFFMGDNRDISNDGRSWGFVPRKNLKGKANRVSFSVAFNGALPKVNLSRTGKSLY